VQSVQEVYILSSCYPVILYLSSGPTNNAVTTCPTNLETRLGLGAPMLQVQLTAPHKPLSYNIPSSHAPTLQQNGVVLFVALASEDSSAVRG
jgi:hypothetical protein